jgi:hypothetical protein
MPRTPDFIKVNRVCPDVQLLQPGVRVIQLLCQRITPNPRMKRGAGNCNNPITWRCSTMLSRGWRIGALAIGAAFAFAGTTSAGDDVTNLKLGASSAAIDDSGSGLIEEGRALPQDDVTDVNLRYRLGYARGASGGAYILPRFYAFRAGFSDGLYGNSWAGYGWGARWGYWGPRWAYGGPRWAGFWGAGRWGYYPGSYGYGGYYPAYVSYSSPAYYSSPCGCSSASYIEAPSGTSYGGYSQPMPMPEPKLAHPGPGLPLEPTPKMNYRYDGGPVNPVPQPNKQPSVRSNSEGRLVSIPAAKKHSYAAYGENRMTKSDPDAALLVKQD